MLVSLLTGKVIGNDDTIHILKFTLFFFVCKAIDDNLIFVHTSSMMK
jgi:hypothetical protein